MSSAMRETMERQGEVLAGILADLPADRGGAAHRA
jgi:hypothetical protein